ncbi:MAG: hypothetical protein M9916_08140 [Crocinitomicaceae bacterium]|nr:hypothetical protein [Crocinitomicaceae bacterium]
MKNVIIVVLFLVSNLLHGQENKPKFYDRLQIVAEFQLGRQKKIVEEHDLHIPGSPYYKKVYNSLVYTYGMSLNFKNSYFSTGLGGYYVTPKLWGSYNYFRLQYQLSANLLFFTTLAKNKLRLYLGPDIALSCNFLFFQKKLGLGYGVEFSIYNVWVKFSRYNQDVIKHPGDDILFNKSFLFSIGYGIDMNLFRKKEKKRYDI